METSIWEGKIVFKKHYIKDLYLLIFWKYQLDHDHDGEIPNAELRTLLNNVAESSIPPSVIDEIIKRADYDHNG